MSTSCGAVGDEGETARVGVRGVGKRRGNEKREVLDGSGGVEGDGRKCFRLPLDWYRYFSGWWTVGWL